MNKNSGQFSKSILYGFGIDDTDYQKERRIYSGNTSKVIWYCETFSRWRNMVKRCYSGTDKSYIGVTICEEWKYFSNYKSWFEIQPKPDCEYDVDKDILQGLSRTYSPDTCVILPRRINQFLSVANKGLPGVYFEKARNKYQAYCASLEGKRITLGRHETELSAHRSWQLEKSTQLDRLIVEYSSEVYCDGKILSKLQEISLKLKTDYQNGVPTMNLKLGG